MQKCKVVVIMGGESSEREVSLRSGQAVFNALKTKGYDVEALDINANSAYELKQIKPDVAFLALHGKKGEDGTVQGMLEILGIPYTGPGVACSAICMNKVLTKKMFSYENIPTADFVILTKSSLNNDDKAIKNVVEKIGLPMVIKASTQGSSIGTYIVRQENDILPAIQKALAYDQEILIEKFIDGIEITASIIGNENPVVLPVIEITSENEFYDFESKYTPGMCHHIIPARISKEINEKIKNISEKVYTSLGCRGFSRVDFIIDQNGNPYVLEVNTIPGMTEMSLVPDAARAVAISFEDLVEKIVELARQ
ncbi:MAG: D-alanine--D-alanine ligase [Syntrophomonas sp.]